MKLRQSVVQQVYANNHVDPPWSHFWSGAILLGFTLVLVAGLRGIVRARRSARRAAAVEIGSGKLQAGAAMLKGVARSAMGDGSDRPLVRVEITQEGTEQRAGNGWRHTWREVARSVESNPFYLELKTGERLRVEPGERPLMVDTLDEGTREGRERRSRVAELSAGEQVIVAGKLEVGFDHESGGEAANYREAPTAWIMRPEGGRLHLSTEPLERRHRERARALTLRSIGAAVLMLATLGAFSPYVARLALGSTVEAEIKKLHKLSKKGRRGLVYSYGLSYRVVGVLPSAGPRSGWIDLDDEDYRRLKNVRRFSLRFLPERFAFATTGGPGASTHVAALFGGVLALLFAFVLVFDAPLPWYEGLLVEEGDGRL